MNVKEFLISSVVGAIVLFLLGWLIYGLILAYEPNTDHCDKETFNLAFIFISEVLMSMVLALIFTHWSSMRSFGSGAKTGAIYGLLLAAAFSSAMYAFKDFMTMEIMAMDAVISAVRFAIAGGVMGLVLGMMGGGDSE